MEQVEYYMFKVQANTLKNPKKDIFDRIEAMVYLKEDGSLDAIDALIKGFKKETRSDVLRHEICYYIGQMGKTQEHIDKIQAFFEEEVCKEHPKFVLHEIVESMGNINHENSMTLLERFRDEKDAILYESCYIALKQMEWKKATENGKSEGLDMATLKTQSQNPSPPFNYIKESKYADV